MGCLVLNQLSVGLGHKRNPNKLRRRLEHDKMWKSLSGISSFIKEEDGAGSEETRDKKKVRQES